MGKYMGAFPTAEEAIAAAKAAQRDLIKNYTVKDRQRMIDTIRADVGPMIPELCQDEYNETGYGRPGDKMGKNSGAILNCPTTEDITATVYYGSDGLVVDAFAPFGVIGSVTPVTNPFATVIGNAIVMLAGGNTVVFNAHPAAKNCSLKALDLVNRSIVKAGGPENCATMAEDPTMETLGVIMNDPEIHLMVGTGGPGMVRTLMASGKKVVAAGPGNPPCIVDSSADIERAAYEITMSHSADNNIMCIAEKEIFVLEDVYDQFIAAMEKVGDNYHLTREEADKVTATGIITNADGSHATNKKFVGKDAKVILAAAGIDCGDRDPRLAFFDAEYDDLYVQVEQLQPILPIVKVKDWETAKEWAYETEHHNRHSSAIWSKNIYHITEFGKLMETTIFVANGPTRCGFGSSGASDGPTIATPTGEGPTRPRSFCRIRRFCLADGQGYIL